MTEKNIIAGRVISSISGPKVSKKSNKLSTRTEQTIAVTNLITENCSKNNWQSEYYTNKKSSCYYFINTDHKFTSLFIFQKVVIQICK